MMVEPVERGLLGVSLAGGKSVRFGSPKALAALGGKRMAEWALESLDAAVGGSVMIANETAIPEMLGLPHRADLRPGLGPAAGLETALAWAEWEGLEGVFLLACDMPHVTAEVIRRIVRESAGAQVGVPQDTETGRLQPLCAVYRVGVLPEVGAFLDFGGRSMLELLERLAPTPLDTSSWPEVSQDTFLNVNTLEDLRRAEEVLTG